MMLDDRPGKIITFWIIAISGLAVYFATDNYFAAAIVLMLSAPFRNNIYADESLNAAAEELPILSKICVFGSAVLALYFAYDVAVNDNSLEFHSITFVLAPIGFVYLYRDILLYREIKKIKG